LKLMIVRLRIRNIRPRILITSLLTICLGKPVEIALAYLFQGELLSLLLSFRKNQKKLM